MQKVLFIAFVLHFPFLLMSQTGIKGRVLDKENREVLEGAAVYIPEIHRGTYADAEGYLEFDNLSPGTYTLICSYISYRRDTLLNIEVQAGKYTRLEFLMENLNRSGVEEIQIIEVRSRASEASLVTDLRESDQVVSGVSSEQIRKGADRDAAEVIRRLPGVTLTDDRFVMIRGLNERYNRVLLNGGPAPGSEADSKAFSFDMIPSGLINRLMITKTASPEFPADVAGGIISIETQTMPNENTLQAGYSSGARQYTTGQDFLGYTGSGTDFLGYYQGIRSMPSWFPRHLNEVRNPEYLGTVSRALPNTWATQTHTALPDQRMNLTYAHRFSLKKWTLGMTQGLTYSNTSAHTKIDRYNYNAYNIETRQSDTIYHYTDYQYNRNVRTGLLSNWALLSPRGHMFQFRNLVNQSGLNQTTLRTGRNLEEGSDVRNYSLVWQQRSLYSTQLAGQHPVYGKYLKADWQLGYAFTDRREPDVKRVRTIRPLGAPDTTPYQIVLAPTASTLDAARFFSWSKEDVYATQANLEYLFSPLSGKKSARLKSGIWTEHTSRDFSARWMSYKKGNVAGFNHNILQQDLETVFSPENMDLVKGLVLTEGTNPSDAYTASNQNLATYISSFIPLSDRFHIQGGLRAEYNRQQLISRDYNNSPVEVDNIQMLWLPSGGITGKISNVMFVRLMGGLTVNRPEFRELAPFAYYDFAFNNVLYGNPELKTPRIQNFDLRWEYYPSAEEFIHLGGFIKKFINPVEQFFVPGTGSGGTRNFAFSNADQAHSIGLEAEIRKSFHTCMPVLLLRDMGVILNAALIKSEVDLGAVAKGQTQVRPMQGQAPYVINSGLYYRPDSSGFQCMILHNVYGKRLFAAGTFGTPDIYEMPRHQLDLILSQKLSKRTELRFSIQDILNARFYLQQDSNEDGKIQTGEEIILDTRRGRNMTLGINIRL